MAMIKCPECGHDVSTLADRCPNCGAPVASMGLTEGAPGRRPPPAVAMGSLPLEEQVIFRTRLHWSIFLAPLFALLITMALTLAVIGGPNLLPPPFDGLGQPLEILAAVLGFLSLAWLFARLVTWLSSSVTLTDRRLTARQGFLDRHSVDIPLGKIESMSLERGLGGQVFGYGNVIVTGSGGTSERFHHIAAAGRLNTAVQRQIAEFHPLR
jgi:uncharacterized membrane protein YdbT with pleckstrin-like domain